MVEQAASFVVSMDKLKNIESQNEILTSMSPWQPSQCKTSSWVFYDLLTVFFQLFLASIRDQ